MAGTKTPVFDWNAGDFKVENRAVVVVTGTAAVEQVVLKAEATARGVYMIYANLEDPDLHHKYGSDVPELLTRGDMTEDIRISEIKRAVREAIIYDPWVTDVYKVDVYSQVDTGGVRRWYTSFTMDTIYDTKIPVEGVALDG